MKKSTKNKIITFLSIFLVCALLGGSLYFGISWWKDYKQHKDVRDTWQKVRDIAEDTDDEKQDDYDIYDVNKDGGYDIIDNKKSDPETNSMDGNMLRRYDIQDVAAINPDAVMWLYIPDTMIDYPVMQEPEYSTIGKVTEPKYLHSDIYGNYSIAGSLFVPADYEGFDKGELSHKIIYGHNMRDGSMFGTLSYFKSEDFYNGHMYFYLYYPDKTERWIISSVSHVFADASLYNTPYEFGTEKYRDMLEDLKSISYYDTNIDEFDTDVPAITLSTCDWGYENRGGRLTVSGVLDKVLVWS